MVNFTKDDHILHIQRIVDITIRFYPTEATCNPFSSSISIFPNKIQGFQWQKEPWLHMRLFKISWSYKVLLPPNFALTGLHTLYTSLDCILDLQLKIKNFKYSVKNFHLMTQASPRWLMGSMDCSRPRNKVLLSWHSWSFFYTWFLMSVCLNSMHFQC